MKRRYLVERGILYDHSDPDDNPILRIYVPGHLRQMVVIQYHNKIATWVFKRHMILSDKNISGKIYSRNYTSMCRHVSSAKLE